MIAKKIGEFTFVFVDRSELNIAVIFSDHRFFPFPKAVDEQTI